MNDETLVKKVVADIKRGWALDGAPRRVHVVGGNASVRHSVVSDLRDAYEKTTFVERTKDQKMQKLILPYFIGRYDKVLC